MSWVASENSWFFADGDLRHYDPKAVGFCASGGGYRATLFHAGAIIRLNELGVLKRLDRISGVSGGSIATGILARAWPNLEFGDDGVATRAGLDKYFVEKVIDATSRSLDVRVGLAGFVPFISAGNRLADLYDRYIFDGMMLSDLPEHPRFIFNALNLQTQGLFRFTKHYLADWRALRSTVTTIRIADAVAASSAFPPVLAPLRLDLRDETVTVPEGARFDDPALLKEPILVDGGVYDNLGLESVWKRCGVLIASYAGHNAAAEPSNFTFDHLMTVVNSFLASSIDWRERMLVAMFQREMEDGLTERRGAYWTAGTKIANFPIHDGWKPSAAEFEAAKLSPTRLDGFDHDLQVTILRAGYAFADAGIRSYLMPDAAPPAGAPV